MNMDRARKIMEQKNLQALIASSPENIAYSSDLVRTFCPCVPASQLHVILPLEKGIEPAIIVPKVQLDYYFCCHSWIKDVKSYGDFYIFKPERSETLGDQEREFADLLDNVKSVGTPIEALAQALDERGLSNKRIGLDDRTLCISRYREIEKKLGDAEIVPAGETFREVRMVKTSEEVERLQRAADINDKAMEATLEEVRVGMTGKQIWDVYDAVVTKEGGKSDYVEIRSGPFATPTFPMISDRALREGDILRIDSDVTYKDYFSDEARTLVLGKPTEKLRKYHAAMVEGYEKASETIKPGTRASTIFDVAVKTTRAAGIPHLKRHACGHALGIECYDPPLISATNDTELEENMVINVEISYYELGFGTLHVEDAFLVVKGGCRRLQKSNAKLRVK